MTEDCSICLDEILTRSTGCTELTCGHKYHPRCIGKWLYKNPSCPKCRNKTVEMETPEKVGDAYGSTPSNNINLDYINHIFITRAASAAVESAAESAAESAVQPVSLQNSDIPHRDVELVAQQSDVSMNVALEALQRYNGDIVNAIMSLSPPLQLTMTDMPLYDETRDIITRLFQDANIPIG